MTKDILQVHQSEQLLMTNSMLSAILMYCSGKRKQMTFGQIGKAAEEVFEYIKAKKCKTYTSGPPKPFTIKEFALNHGLKISGNYEDRRNGHKAIIDFSDNIDDLKSLSLAYYSAPLGAALHLECMMALSSSYIQDHIKHPLTIDNLTQTTQIICQIFKNEFV